MQYWPRTGVWIIPLSGTPPAAITAATEGGSTWGRAPCPVEYVPAAQAMHELAPLAAAAKKPAGQRAVHPAVAPEEVEYVPAAQAMQLLVPAAVV